MEAGHPGGEEIDIVGSDGPRMAGGSRIARWGRERMDPLRHRIAEGDAELHSPFSEVSCGAVGSNDTGIGAVGAEFGEAAAFVRVETADDEVVARRGLERAMAGRAERPMADFASWPPRARASMPRMRLCRTSSDSRAGSCSSANSPGVTGATNEKAADGQGGPAGHQIVQIDALAPTSIASVREISGDTTSAPVAHRSSDAANRRGDSAPPLPVPAVPIRHSPSSGYQSIAAWYSGRLWQRGLVGHHVARNRASKQERSRRSMQSS